MNRPSEEQMAAARTVLLGQESAPNGKVQGANPPGKVQVAPSRYENRRVDIAALLAQPRRPTPWRCGQLVADRTLTVLGGKSGDGKSWLALGMAVGVARGVEVAGVPCAKGTAIYVDAEMGAVMFVERLRDAGIGAEIELRDAMGLDVSKEHDLAWLRGEIEATGAKLVVIDSLRRLVPSKSENDSDDMAPAVAALAKLARDTGAAVLLVHHMGENTEKFYRGSTGIKDQCDALFALLRDDNDPDVRRLTCGGGKGKVRYAPEPQDRHMKLSVEDGGMIATDEPEKPDREAPVRDDLTPRVLAALTDTPQNRADIARAVERSPQDGSVGRVLEGLTEEGRAVRSGTVTRPLWNVPCANSLGNVPVAHSGLLEGSGAVVSLDAARSAKPEADSQPLPNVPSNVSAVSPAAPSDHEVDDDEWVRINAAAERVRRQAARPRCACPAPLPDNEGRCERCAGFPA